MIAEVIVDVESSETDKIFDYIIPTYLNVEVGMRVVVPFGARQIEGYCINKKPESLLPKAKLKNIISLCDEYAVINTEMLKLMPSMIEKYNLKTVDVLRLFLPSSMRLNKVKPVFLEYVFLNKEVVIDEVINSLQKNANKQKELLLYLKKTNEEEKVKLNKQFGSVVVNKFLVLEVLKSRQIEVKRTPKTSFSENAKQNLTLTKAQQNAVSSVIKSTNRKFRRNYNRRRARFKLLQRK